MKHQIQYIKCGGSYQLTRTYRIQTAYRPKVAIRTPRIHLSRSGMLTIVEGYCWDGTSGPVIDRKTNMRAGLVHDALYELMRKGELAHQNWRKADQEFARILREDGAWGITVRIDMAGLRVAGGKYAHPKQKKKRHTAP